MIDYFVLGYHMAREAISTGEIAALLTRQISRNRLLTPAEMDLSLPLPDGKVTLNPELRFIELYMDDIQAGKWTFSVRSRGMKALYKLKRGIRGFALVQDNIVIGDVWCVVPHNGKPASHPDLKMLGLTCGNGEVYAFDMLIDPAYRGKNLAVPLQRAIQRTLKNEGFVKVYGFFYDDNLPALWMHRMLKYKELTKRKVSRFFFFSIAGWADPVRSKTKKKTTTQAT
jgi:GNAT superfamily N-acetyltransferase